TRPAAVLRPGARVFRRSSVVLRSRAGLFRAAARVLSGARVSPVCVRVVSVCPVSVLLPARLRFVRRGLLLPSPLLLRAPALPLIDSDRSNEKPRGCGAFLFPATRCGAVRVAKPRT